VVSAAAVAGLHTRPHRASDLMLTYRPMIVSTTARLRLATHWLRVSTTPSQPPYKALTYVTAVTAFLSSATLLMYTCSRFQNNTLFAVITRVILLLIRPPRSLCNGLVDLTIKSTPACAAHFKPIRNSH